MTLWASSVGKFGTSQGVTVAVAGDQKGTDGLFRPMGLASFNNHTLTAGFIDGSASSTAFFLASFISGPLTARLKNRPGRNGRVCRELLARPSKVFVTSDFSLGSSQSTSQGIRGVGSQGRPWCIPGAKESLEQPENMELPFGELTNLLRLLAPILDTRSIGKALAQPHQIHRKKA